MLVNSHYLDSAKTCLDKPTNNCHYQMGKVEGKIRVDLWNKTVLCYCNTSNDFIPLLMQECVIVPES